MAGNCDRWCNGLLTMGYISTSLNTYILTLLTRAVVAEVGVTHKGSRKGTLFRVAARAAHWSGLALGG